MAYVLLDSPGDSIMNLMEARFKQNGEGVTLGRYMDSFPFPYYVMLNNIEALPCTLADLLRQVWCSTFYVLSFISKTDALLISVILLCRAVV